MELVEKSYNAASRGMAWLCETSYKIARYAVPMHASELHVSVNMPVFFLGERYEAEDDDACQTVFERILMDTRSRIWLTYRTGFERIDGTHFSSDAGWGCMMRTGQMILAQALVVLMAGRDWRSRLAIASPEDQSAVSTTGEADREGGTLASQAQAFDEARLLMLFADHADAPFSIHKIVLEGAAQGHVPGSWLGPASISQVIAALVKRARDPPRSGQTPRHAETESTVHERRTHEEGTNHSLVREAPAGAPITQSTTSSTVIPPLVVHVAMDGIIYLKNVRDLAEQPDGSWTPVLLLVPLRLGLEELNAMYAPCLQGMFELPQSLGVIGGRPRRSHYFVGIQRDQLLYFDPHEVQQALSHSKPSVETCHFPWTIRTTPLCGIDPSLAVGFLCTSDADLDDFCRRCDTVFQRGLALFSISSSEALEWEASNQVSCENVGEEDDDVVRL